MNIKHIEADNILKYRKMRIANLPTQGQIAVAGPNEAGKTAIGETICLGLFGRTFSLGPDRKVANLNIVGLGEFERAEEDEAD